MSAALRDKLLAVFEVEHKEHLESARQMLDELEASSWAASIDLVELHRRLHSLKGAARAVDLRPIETLAHQLESFVERCQKGTAIIDATNARVLREAMDTIEDWVAAEREGAALPPLDLLMQEIGGLDSPSAGPDSPPEESDPPSEGLDSASERDMLRRAGPSEAAPPEPAVSDVPEAPPQASRTPGAVLTTMRVATESFDELLRGSGDLAMAVQVEEQLTDRFRRLALDVQTLRTQLKGVRRPAQSADLSDWDTAERAAEAELAERIEAIADSVSVLGRDQRTHAWNLRQLEQRIESQIDRVRMVPADGIFMDLRKSVRDLARDEGKQVRVDIRGLQTFADRSTLQRLRDPVLHLLRNAVAHGIEAPADRRAAGKPEEARISLEISAAGSRLTVLVRDDGRGIDRRRVSQVAGERGLQRDDSSEELDGAALAALLSEPGLSTAKSVSEVSGRGLGLSIVRKAAQSLQGSLEIETSVGGGTEVMLSVPIRVSRASMLVVRAAGQLYCIPAGAIEQLHRVNPAELDVINDKTVLPSEGSSPLPVMPLSELLWDGQASTAWDNAERVPVVEIKQGAFKLGVIVDDFEAVREMLVRDLGLSTPIVAGGVILGSGEVVPVLDTHALLDKFSQARSGWKAAAAGSDTKGRRPRVLVVDDSITTRTLEKSMLETNGYDVGLAVDGLDALSKLRNTSVDLIVSDIEMPRLDGFGLLTALKRDRDLAQIPIVLVTSRSAEPDRLRGLELGADAYVVKQRFDQDALLEIIEQLL